MNESDLTSGNCGNNCQDALDRLWEYLDAELGDPDAATVRAHLEECQGCLEEYDVDHDRLGDRCPRRHHSDPARRADAGRPGECGVAHAGRWPSVGGARLDRDERGHQPRPGVRGRRGTH